MIGFSAEVQVKSQDCCRYEGYRPDSCGEDYEMEGWRADGGPVRRPHFLKDLRLSVVKGDRNITETDSIEDHVL